MKDNLLQLSDFDFDLPPELIAQAPLADRSASRLLSMLPDGRISNDHFRDLPYHLAPGDLLVVNDSKVFPARLFGTTDSGGSVEVLLLEQQGSERWLILARPAKKVRKGTHVRFDADLDAIVVEEAEAGRRVVELHCKGALFDTLERVGKTPLPPYIKRSRTENNSDRERYQTVYAAEVGSVAAPTAGLHFTPEMLEELLELGVRRVSITLHVGFGTFQPIRNKDFSLHRMEAERYEVNEKTVAEIEATKCDGGLVVAVGTTTVRALESAARCGVLSPGSGKTDLFLKPGDDFKVVDALLTNFHLPKSSLFLLVSALGGVEQVKEAYQEAVREGYRFCSYGDCMLLYPAANGTLVDSCHHGS